MYRVHLTKQIHVSVYVVWIFDNHMLHLGTSAPWQKNTRETEVPHYYQQLKQTCLPVNSAGLHWLWTETETRRTPPKRSSNYGWTWFPSESRRPSTQMRTYCLDVCCRTATVSPVLCNGSLSPLALIASASLLRTRSSPWTRVRAQTQKLAHVHHCNYPLANTVLSDSMRKIYIYIHSAQTSIPTYQSNSLHIPDFCSLSGVFNSLVVVFFFCFPMVK